VPPPALPGGSPKLPRWSIILPAYNEELRILSYLRAVTAYFDAREEPYEVLVVDEGSQDRTAATIASLQTVCPRLQLIRLPDNRGKGYAVRTGMLAAKGTLRLFADADGATPIEEVAKLEAHLAAGADLAIGSRAVREPTCSLHATWPRRMLGRVFNTLLKGMGVGGIADTQCGFKLFRVPVATDLFSIGQIDRYGFDGELLFVAQKRGYVIAEVAVNWADQPGSKVKVVRDGLRMVRDAWYMRRNYRYGLYGSPIVPSQTRVETATTITLRAGKREG
jgi:dolichyl-phosphate beta-glucosyltransferase